MSKQKKIVFQGEPGANSDLACRQAFPDYEPVPCPTFEDAFAVVKSGKAELAMIPIENSVAGRVADIHYLISHEGVPFGSRRAKPAKRKAGAALHIIGEHFMPVRHQLLAVKSATLRSIKTVESHVHALGQCRKAIAQLKLKPIVAADTAGSAREVSEAGDPTRASIASKLCADIYGLKILKSNIEDEEHNTTRFVVLAPKAKWAPRDTDKSRNANVVTTFIFQVRNIPAALYKAMGGFATNGINMTKLESYMIEGNFFATQFYADVEGHPDDRNLKLALEELDFFSDHLKILGVYPAHAFRNKNHSSSR